MKNKMFISGLLVSIALLTFSCTNDDYEIATDNNSHLKTMTNDELKNLNENTNIEVQDSINKNLLRTEDTTEGDPLIPKPPRKD